MTHFETLRDQFTLLVPELSRMASGAFRCLDSEARDEAVQNTLALSWKWYRLLIQQGRGEEPNIVKSCLWFSIKQTRAGRRIEGVSRGNDVFKSVRRGRARFEQIEPDQFISDSTPIPERVAFRLDLPIFLSRLTNRQQCMANDLALGMSTSNCADKHHVTPGAVSQFRVRFKELFEEFMAA